MARLERRGFVVMCIEPEGTWEYERLPAILTTNKTEIVADGIDTTSVIAEVPSDTSEITFYDADENPITTAPVIDGRASLDITTTTPGTIRIRAGDKTRTRLNEITIRAIPPQEEINE